MTNTLFLVRLLSKSNIQLHDQNKQAFFSLFTGRNMPEKIGACGGLWKKARSKEYVVVNRFFIYHCLTVNFRTSSANIFEAFHEVNLQK